jgi:uncharacterized protein YyaL (SSP411 family)
MTGETPNRLIHEKSPYLLQHAYNPVDWYPWGEEALGRAKAEDKPVFLSIGYSTCHWCHVMARESFENQEVAALMNRYFVNIKVDREERPEIDQVYMEAALALMGTGGWPLTIVMTPDGEPFFAATYIPRESGLGLAGMLDLLPGIADAWRERREEVLTAADQLTLLVRMRPGDQGTEGAPTVIARVVDELKAGFDPEHGGFGGPPKFPAPHALVFLLRTFRRTGDRDLLAMAEKTLQAMHAGGIHDHIGSGFHRYATDNAWRLPHFEKMLYDQALLAMAYTEAYLVTGKTGYRDIADETLGYMVMDLRSEEGAFSSAEDAESDGREGGFYLWTRDEIEKILSGTELAAFVEYYGICREGNLPREARTGRGENVLFIAASPEQVERDLGMKPGELGPVLASARGKVRAARARRARPARDGKILTDWNGLAIVALALGSRAFGSREYLDAAKNAAGVILARLTTGDGGLLHRYVDGDAAVPGNADDYAFLGWAFLELYHASLDPGFLSHAVAITDRFLARFWDGEQGGFFFTPDDGERLIARLKPVHDGSVPSANSVTLSNLVTLFRLTGRTLYLDRSRELAAWYLRERASSATASTWMMASLDLAHAPSIEVAVAGDPDAPETRALLDAVRSRARPGITVLLKRPAGDALLERLSPFLKEFTAEPGKAVAYLCRNHACELPITDPEALGRALDTPLRQEPGWKEQNGQ